MNISYKKREAKYLQVLGEISVNLAELEDSILQCIVFISGDPEGLIGVLIGSEQMDVMLAKLNKVIGFYINDKEISSKFKSIANELDRINEKRNTFIHARWNFHYYPEAEYHKIKRNLSKKELLSRDNISVEKLKEYADSILRASENLEQFISTNRVNLHKINAKRRAENFSLEPNLQH